MNGWKQQLDRMALGLLALHGYTPKRPLPPAGPARSQPANDAPSRSRCETAVTPCPAAGA